MRNRAVGPAALVTCLLVVWVLGCSLSAAQDGRGPELTAEERAWLERQEVIRIGPAPNFPPIEFFDDTGTYSGIVADYAALLEARLGIEFEVQQFATWDDVVQSTRRREIDVWLEAAENDERREYMRFTEPYLFIPSLIIVRNDHRGILGVGDLAGKKVVATEGYAVVDYLRENVPGIDLVTVPSIEVGLERVSFGSADALVASSASTSYYIERLGLTNLKVAGESGWTWELSIGSRSDWPLLHDILTKTLATISPEERRAIYRHWVSFEDASGDVSGTLRWLFWLAGLALLAVLVALLVRRRPRAGIATEVRLGVFSSWPVYLAGVAVIAVIMAGNWWADQRITERMQDDVGKAVQTVLRTTSEAIYQFFQEREEEALVWAGHEDVWSLCRTLERSPTSDSRARASLEMQLESLLDRSGNLGFLMLTPDGDVLASNDERRLGRLVDSEAVRDLLETALASPNGASVGLPQRETSGNDAQATMMLAAAAPDQGDGVPCVLTLLMDPQAGFSEILHRGRIGDSGESYAFNRDGLLISESRFEDDLRRIGILGEGQSGILNVEIRDPGGNLLRGHHPDRPREEQPLTEMARSATSARTDMNLEGYNDYRGVPVIGAWTWDEAKGLGIATEIDVDEAYASLLWVHRILLGGTALLVVMVMALMAAFTLHNIRRRRIEERLAESEERGRLILGSAGEGIFGVDKDGLVNFMNSAGLRMLGFSSGEVIGHRIHSLVHHTRPDGTPYPVDECPMYHSFTQGDAATRDDEVLWRKDGSCFPVEYTSKPILKDDGIVGSVVIFRDIRERKEAQDRLIRQSAALEAAADGIAITATDGTIRWVNQAFSHLTGYSFKEAVGGNPRVLKSGEHGPEFYRNMWETITAGNVWTGEVVNRHKDGSIYTEEMSITPVRNSEGTVVDFVAIKRDITERKLMEAELERARKRMENELNVGREIQMSMLPLTFPAFPDRSELDVFATLHPAREVGGDFYDFFFVDYDRFCLCIGDVSGKGVPSALFMAVSQTLIKSRAVDDTSTASILSHVNQELSKNNKESMFVTVFVGILKISTGEFLYTNAGHNPPYIKRSDGELERLTQRHGPILGAVEGLSYGEDRTTIHAGDLIFLYTDGVTEAMNHEARLYSEERLQQVLGQCTENSAEGVIRTTLDDVWAFQGNAEQADDVTVMAVSYRGNSSAEWGDRLELKIENQLDEINRVNETFNGFAEAHGISDPIRRKLNLVFDELLNNVISYGYEDEARHWIELSVSVVGGLLTVSISDDGRPFNPLENPIPDTGLSLEEREIGGLGLHILRSLMDNVAYERRESRNVVRLEKRLPFPEE